MANRGPYKIGEARDLTGRQIGLLTVLEPTTERRSQSVVWICRCACGKITKTTAKQLLRSGNGRHTSRRSCGCVKQGSTSLLFKGRGNLSGQKWAQIYKGAQRRDIEFSLSIDYAWEIFLKQKSRCALTGIELRLSPGDMSAGATTASLDRIDSSKGYIEGNVQWVHVAINLMKQTLSNEEFVNWCHTVSRFHQN